MTAIKVIITDDHPMLVEGIAQVLRSMEHISLVGCFSTGEELLTNLPATFADVLLLDMHLPGISGKELAQKVKACQPDLRILVLSGNENPIYVEEMLHNGCSGYIYKSTTNSRLLREALEYVYSGGIFLEEDLKKQLLTGILKTKSQAAKTASLLTRKEKEIMQFVVNGFMNQEIAEALSISIRTVESHRASLLHKLGVRNTVGLVKKAIELHII